VGRVEDVVPNLLSEAREATFELERFELADGRLELTGRWFEVKGRRFMRPSLIVRGHDGETRLLADLADKPWAAESGELWQAAFPWDGELDADNDAELTVAPDLTVELRIPDAARSRRAQRKRNAQTRARPRGDDDARDARAKPGAPSSPAPVTHNHAQIEHARALSSARAEIATLRERIEELGRELERERTRFADELREAQQVAAEAARGHDEAVTARRKAIESRDTAQHTVEQALAARGKAKRAAEHALAERDKAMARLDEALGQRDQAGAQRDQAAKELERVSGERDELARANERLRHQSENSIATRGAAMVMRNAAIESPAERPHAHRLGVAIAVISLLVVALAVIIILSSH
jgi:hypothetical protein